MGVKMNLNEQKAFVEAYNNALCYMPKDKVAEFVYDYVNKNSLEHFNIYPTSSIIDALLIWNYATKYQLKQLQGNTA
jgi:hypothetical protein